MCEGFRLEKIYDLIIIGGGINGTGIARDAAGRGLSVLLCEQNDLASGTSSASSKLIHGGLRYLEQGELRLVAESLAEREILLRIAPHLVRPQRFVMPWVQALRPAWLIRLGLFLYDHLSRRTQLPSSTTVNLTAPPYRGNLRTEIVKGFTYSDCTVDDARLVILNAKAAAALGAIVMKATRCTGASVTEGIWSLSLQYKNGAPSLVKARVVINAGGPWVETIQRNIRQPAQARAALVKGSHIIVPEAYQGKHAYILQNSDRRVIFMIPYQEQYTLIGTTDVKVESVEQAGEITDKEISYLCAAVNRYLAKPVSATDIVSSYSGIRALFNDGSDNPSQITRDYTLSLDEHQGAPLLSIFGGKITSYRKLAERVMKKIAPYFPGLRPAWTANTALPGGDIADWSVFIREIEQRYPDLPRLLLESLARRHGSLITSVLGNCKTEAELGECFGHGLYARETDYFINQEWALTADDILWRRTKLGLHFSEAEKNRLAAYLSTRAI